MDNRKSGRKGGSSKKVVVRARGESHGARETGHCSGAVAVALGAAVVVGAAIVVSAATGPLLRVVLLAGAALFLTGAALFLTGAALFLTGAVILVIGGSSSVRPLDRWLAPRLLATPLHCCRAS